MQSPSRAATADLLPVRPAPSLVTAAVGFMGSTVALTALLVLLSAL